MILGATRDGASLDPEALLRLRFLALEARRLRPQRTSMRPGPFVTRRRGRGSETDDVRPWFHGDDVRHLDRNVTARTGTPHVRTFRDERERTTMLVADFRPPMLFGTRRCLLSVAAAEFLALAGWTAASEGGRVALLALTADGAVSVKPAVGERAMIGIVGGLVRAHRSALASRDPRVAPLAPDLAAAARLVPAGATMVAATALDAPGDGFDETVRHLLERVDLSVAVVSDAFERDPPAGRYPYVDAEGRRAVGAVPANDGNRTDARPARLEALGARAALLQAEHGPRAMVAVVEALHDPR